MPLVNFWLGLYTPSYTSKPWNGPTELQNFQQLGFIRSSMQRKNQTPEKEFERSPDLSDTYLIAKAKLSLPPKNPLLKFSSYTRAKPCR
jgi:hypothetical protein